MTFQLSMRTSGPAPAPLRLDGRDVVLGRSAGVDWVVPDPRVSGRHLMIGYRDGAYLVRDTSSNGTSVNGRPLSGIHRLVPGDVLRIGDTDLLFELAPAGLAAAPEEDAPAAAAGIVPADALAAALATLLATRGRQLRELGTAPDALADHPLADPRTAAARLAALPPPAARAAVDAAVHAVERHHAASLTAMRAALREVAALLDPAALAAAPGLPPAGDARDAALWRRHRELWAGTGADEGFAHRFTASFRRHHEEAARLTTG